MEKPRGAGEGVRGESENPRGAGEGQGKGRGKASPSWEGARDRLAALSEKSRGNLDVRGGEDLREKKKKKEDSALAISLNVSFRVVVLVCEDRVAGSGSARWLCG